MTTSRVPHDPEDLLAHDAFVRSLARQLVREADVAEDAAQATWLATLRGEAPGGPGLRGFLATVLRRWVGKHRRGERRELARRLASAPRPDVPSPAEILAREAQRAEVVAAVLALEPSQRDAVLLRYFEQLPPRAIAARLRVPVETVRTRLKRALASLRARLDDEHRDRGGRAAWLALLAPYSKSPPPPPWLQWTGATVLTGGIGMSVHKVGVALVAVALFAVGWWTMGPPAGGAEAAPPGAGAPELATSAAAAVAPGATLAATPAADAGTPLPERRAAASAAAATTGTLAVRVVLAADGTPVEDCLVEVHRSGDAHERPRARTGADGRVRFPELSPGKVYGVVLRGNSEWGDEAVVVAGGVVETELKLEVGMDVRGIVVDGTDRPIAGADVLVADWGGGEAVVLARTAADGTFGVRAVATHCHIGARANGFAASSMRQFTAGKGAAVDLRIVLAEPAVELRGIVVDPQGRAVAGARVRAGSPDQHNHTMPDGARAMRSRPELTRTDERGAFVLRHLPAGKVPLAVRAPVGSGLAPWRDDVELAAGPPRQLTVTLVRGARLEGRVTDGTGQAVPRADVRIGGWDEFTDHRGASAADGAFGFDGIAAGEVTVCAEADKRGKAEAKLQAIAGQTLVWNPVLDAGLTIEGRVVDADGKPVSRAMVEGRLDGVVQGQPWWGLENTDAEGRFRLANLPAGALAQLSVRRKSAFPEKVLHGVAAGARDVVVELPNAAWVHVRGTVLDPDGKPLPSVHVMPMLKNSFSGCPAETADPASGAIRLGPYPPGSYCLHLAAAGYPTIRLPWRDVKPDETWDLGELRFVRGGDLVLNLVAASSDLLADASATVHARGESTRADGHPPANVELRDGQGRCGPLPPGDYHVRVRSTAAAAVTLPCTIVAGRETRLDVPLAAGARVELVATFPAAAVADGSAPELVQFEVLDAEHVVASPTFLRRDRTAMGHVILAPGSYRVRAHGKDCTGTVELTVTAGTPAVARVEVRRD